MTMLRTAGWAAAALLVLGGHGAAALWILQTRPDPPEPPGEAIFVDLTPPPPAPDFTVPDSGLALPESLTDLPQPEPADFSVPLPRSSRCRR